mgnify:CR=1 FL=1
MKKLAAKKNVECMACLQCVAACSEAFYKEFDEEKSCVRIVAKGTGAKPNTCIQCGKCMRTCEHEAITQNPKTGVYMINKKKCVSCGKCAEACPMRDRVRGRQPRLQVHCLRHLRQSMPYGTAGNRGEISQETGWAAFGCTSFHF